MPIVIHVQLMLGQSCWREFMCVAFFNSYEEIDSHRKFYDLLSYDLFLSSSAMFLMPEVWGCLWMCPLGLCYTTLCFD